MTTGIGAVARIYSLYEPTFTHTNLHSIEKKTDPALLLEGTGEQSTSEENNTDEGNLEYVPKTNGNGKLFEVVVVDVDVVD